jgi:cytidylate kinase
MYRAFTFLTLESGHDPASRPRMKQLLEKIDFHAEIQNREITLREANRDLGPHTRLPEVNAAVSIVSTLPELREYLVNLQRKLRLSAPLVMEGRDIGTVVCSDSPFKYFIDACPTVRAERRRKQGEKDNLAARDKIDSSRSAAPLLRAADATLLDSGKNDARSLADQIVQEVRSRQKPGPTVP